MATVFAFLATGMDLAVPAHDAGLAVFWGGGLSALVLLLFTFASRHLTGAVLTVLLMVEYFLGPFWVWVFLDETPSRRRRICRRWSLSASGPAEPAAAGTATPARYTWRASQTWRSGMGR